jgi:hypothetical protein
VVLLLECPQSGRGPGRDPPNNRANHRECFLAREAVAKIKGGEEFFFFDAKHVND